MDPYSFSVSEILKLYKRNLSRKMWIKYTEISSSNSSKKYVANVAVDQGKLYERNTNVVDQNGKKQKYYLENIYIEAYAFTDNEPADDEWINKENYTKYVPKIKSLYPILTAKDIQNKLSQKANDTSSSDDMSTSDDEGEDEVILALKENLNSLYSQLSEDEKQNAINKMPVQNWISDRKKLRRKIQIVKNIIENRDAESSDEDEPLHVLIPFIITTNINMFQNLYRNNKDLNVEIIFPKYGTLLHAAAYFGRPKIVEFLIKEGADVEMKHNYKTHLHMAVTDIVMENPEVQKYMKRNFERLKIKCVKLLVEKGADLNAQDRNNNTPLYLLMMSKIPNKIEIAKYLVSKGANTNTLDYFLYQDMRRKLDEDSSALAGKRKKRRRTQLRF